MKNQTDKIFKKLDILRKKLLKDGGFTADTSFNSLNRHSGYFVSIEKPEVICSKEILDQYLFNEIMDQLKVFNCFYIGVWNSNDKIYFNLTKFIRDKNIAISLGLKNNQKAIFDIANNKEIFLCSE
jgi:hypothetical protein